MTKAGVVICFSWFCWLYKTKSGQPVRKKNPSLVARRLIRKGTFTRSDVPPVSLSSSVAVPSSPYQGAKAVRRSIRSNKGRIVKIFSCTFILFPARHVCQLPYPQKMRQGGETAFQCLICLILENQTPTETPQAPDWKDPSKSLIMLAYGWF